MARSRKTSPDVTFLKVNADVRRHRPPLQRRLATHCIVVVVVVVQVAGLNATPAFHVYDEEAESQKELSGIRLITHFHPLARRRGLPGYGTEPTAQARVAHSHNSESA